MESMKKATSVASNLASSIKSAVEVGVTGLVDTSNVKRLHFKNQFFVEYMDMKTVNALYGRPNNDIDLAFYSENNNANNNQTIGKLGYLVSKSNSANQINQDNKDAPAVEPPTEEDKQPVSSAENGDEKTNDHTTDDLNKDNKPVDDPMSKYLAIVDVSKFVPSSSYVSFNRLNGAEIIDPKFYAKFATEWANDPTKSKEWKAFQRKCVTFKDTEQYKAMYEIQYTWKYMLHSLLWDMNDKAKLALRYLYTEYGKEIAQRSNYAQIMYDSSSVLKVFVGMSNTKQTVLNVASSSATGAYNLANKAATGTYNLANKAYNYVKPSNKYMETSTPDSNSTEQMSNPNQGNEPSDDTTAPSENPMNVDEAKEIMQSANIPSLPSPPVQKDVTSTDILIQLRGYYNIPFSTKADRHGPDAYKQYAIDHNKYTELPPYYTYRDACFALETVLAFLTKVNETDVNNWNNVIDIRNSAFAYSKNILVKKGILFNNMYRPEINREEIYVPNGTKHSFFQTYFSDKEKYRDSEPSKSLTELITEITSKPLNESITEKMKKFMEDETNLKGMGVPSMFRLANTEQTAINVALQQIANVTTSAATLGGRRRTRRRRQRQRRWHGQRQRQGKGGGMFSDITQRIKNSKDRASDYMSKKYNIAMEKVKKLTHTNYFLDMIKIAMFHAVCHTYKTYYIAPLFSPKASSPDEMMNTLKMFKTLGLYSMRMANVVCQSPLNRVIRMYEQTGIVSTPHCFQLGFLTSLVIDVWTTIQPKTKKAEDKSEETTYPTPTQATTPSNKI